MERYLKIIANLIKNLLQKIIMDLQGLIKSISFKFTNKLKNAIILINNQPLIVKIFIIIASLLLLYSIFSNRLVATIAYYSVKILITIMPILINLMYILVSYFIVLFVIQFLICKIIPNSAYRKLSWVGVIILINFLDRLGVFGGISVSSPMDSYHYIQLSIKIWLFYYVIILVLLPKKYWKFVANSFFVFFSILSIAATAIGAIPVMGDLFSGFISIVFFIFIIFHPLINYIASLLLTIEYYMIKPNDSTIATLHAESTSQNYEINNTNYKKDNPNSCD